MSGMPESSTRNGKRPSFFKVCIGDFSHQLRIPPEFVKHLDSIPSQKFVLWNSAGRFWHVHVEKVGNILYLKNGWTEFVQDNGIEFGDFLLFSYAGNSKFDVTMYGKDCCEKEAVIAKEKINKPPSCEENQDGVKLMMADHQQCGRRVELIDIDSDGTSENENNMPSLHNISPLCQPATGNKSSALEAASKFITKYPSFKVVMHKTYVQRGLLTLPKRLLKQYIRPVTQSVTLRFSSKSWPVKLCASGQSLRLCGGWPRFAKDNSLQTGDVCIFELIETGKVVLQVSIYRASMDQCA